MFHSPEVHTKGLKYKIYFNLFRILKNVFRDKVVEEIDKSLFVKPEVIDEKADKSKQPKK